MFKPYFNWSRCRCNWRSFWQDVSENYVQINQPIDHGHLPVRPSCFSSMISHQSSPSHRVLINHNLFISTLHWVHLPYQIYQIILCENLFKIRLLAVNTLRMMHPSITALHRSSDWTTLVVPFVIHTQSRWDIRWWIGALSLYRSVRFAHGYVSYASSDGPEPSLAEKPTAPSSIPMAADLGDEFDDVIVTDAMSCSAKSLSGNKWMDWSFPFWTGKRRKCPHWTFT